MINAKHIRCLVLGMLSLFSIQAFSAEVTLPYRGLTLNAELKLAANKSIADGVVLITHGGLAHRGMELIVALQTLLGDLGYSTLAINLSLGVNNRHGMYDCRLTHRHQHAHASQEIAAWVDWLGTQGAQQVYLLGHSRGAGQTALYASLPYHSRVKAVILMAPQTRQNGAAGYEQRYQQPLKPLRQKAQQLSAAGKGNTVMKHLNLLFCRDTSATADSFLSYYGNADWLDSPSIISQIKLPVLVVVASSDEVVVDLPKRIQPIVDKQNNVRMAVIEGAGHFFRDLNAEEVAEIIDEFLQTVTARLSSG